MWNPPATCIKTQDGNGNGRGGREIREAGGRKEARVSHPPPLLLLLLCGTRQQTNRQQLVGLVLEMNRAFLFAEVRFCYELCFLYRGTSLNRTSSCFPFQRSRSAAAFFAFLPFSSGRKSHGVKNDAHQQPTNQPTRLVFLLSFFPPSAFKRTGRKREKRSRFGKQLLLTCCEKKIA